MKDGRIGVGVVGLGRAGWGMHVPALLARADRFRIAAVCDVLPERCAAAASTCGCRAYDQIEALVQDPDVMLVDLATRSSDHAAHALLALEAGRHVMVEKPFGINLAEAETLTRRAAAAGRRLFVHHNRRFEPAFRLIREVMDAGLLGPIHSVSLRRLNFQRRDDWQTLRACGGGQLLNWGPHVVDHALRLLDAPVARQWSALRRVAAVGDAEDHVKIILEGANGRLVDIEISGGAALTEPEWSVRGARGALTCQGDVLTLRYLDPAVPLAPRFAQAGTPGAEAVSGSGGGTRAMTWAPYVNPETLNWVNRTLKPSERAGAGMAEIWDAVHADLTGGAPFPVTLDQALDVMRVIETARQTA